MRLAAAAGFFAVLASFVPPAVGQDKIPDPSVRIPIPLAGAPSTGADEALVTIVEFSDFYCSYCRRANDTLATLLRIYPNRVRVFYRHSLLSDRATLAAEASLAAASRGKFWPMHDRLFSGPAPTSAEEIASLAAEVGLDRDEILAELKAHTFAPRLAVDTELAKGLGLRGVPMFFVNGRPLSGAQSLGVFVKMIEEELALAEARVASGTAVKDIYPTAMSGPDSTLSGVAELFGRGIDPESVAAVGLGREANRSGGHEPLVTIVEFSDYGCRYCRKTHPHLLEMRETYGDDIRLVFRHFPLGGLLKPVAEAAEEAGAQGKFWQFTERVFAADPSGHATREGLLAHARALSLDIEAFERALDEHTHAKEIAKDAAEASALGVSGTPTLFINGRAIVGAPSPEALREMIEIELKAARKLLLESGVDRASIYQKITERE